MPGRVEPPASPAAAKAALRAELRAIRRSIAADPVERAARSARIWAGIVANAHLGGDCLESEKEPAQMRSRGVLLFRSLPGEPDTTAWFAWCSAHHVDAYEPEVQGPDLHVVPGPIDAASLDVVVVPGVAFTADGCRLGQGGGHYDRFLTRLRPDCLTIGVCFAEQLVADLPTEPHDVRVDAVITDALPPILI